MEKANQGLLLYHTPAELLKGILKLVDLEDLLHLSTSCRLFRNIMDKHFWQYCVISRDLDLDLFEDPRKKAIYHVTRTCHECRCRSSTDIPAHYFIKKRLCRACKNTKYRTVTVGTAKRKYTITEEQLGKLQGAKVTNPHNSGFAPMRLFLLSDIQAVAQRRLNKLQKRRIVLERRKLREEQKLAEKQVNIEQLSSQHTACSWDASILSWGLTAVPKQH